MSGSANSNMIKIDNFSGSVSGSITGLSGSASGSMTTVSGSMSAVSACMVTLNTLTSQLDLRFRKLFEFTGGGQADFNNIPQTYKHLILIGQTSGSKGAAGQYATGVGIDFNTDSVSANYAAMTWGRYASLVANTTYTIGGISIADTIPVWKGDNYGAPFFAIIPNYTATSGFYKTAMGLSTYCYGTATTAYGAALYGGTWFSTAAITRLRVFGNYASTARYNFSPGTIISLYGWG